MPSDTNTRGLSFLSGFGLFLTAIVLAYLNTTTTAFLWSTIYVSGIVICTLACAAKLATALGVENKLADAADAIAGVVPFVAIYFDGIQALKYTHDGLSGFMAGVAIIALVFIVAFGVWDALVTWFGAKAAQLDEFVDRAAQAADVMAGR